MNSQRLLGLVVEGNATSSSVLRLPSISEELGPVKAGALRVARRLSNFLRAGYAVGSYDALKPARLIFLRLPDASTPRIVDEICASGMILKNVVFVLCESCLSAAVLSPLQMRGALTATLVPVQTPRKRWFVVEGQLTAVRQVRKFLERNDARAFELRPGAKPLYFASQLLATALPLQLLVSAQHALRSAGISGNPLYELLEEMSFEMFRTFSNGVRLTWPAARTGCSPETCAEYFDHLRAHHPNIATVLEEQLTLAVRFRDIKA